jgi:hypothetical protein
MLELRDAYLIHIHHSARSLVTRRRTASIGTSLNPSTVSMPLSSNEPPLESQSFFLGTSFLVAIRYFS